MQKGKTMADEYINKKDVIDLGVMMQTHLWTREQTYNAIFCLPSADVAPVRHGRWKPFDRTYGRTIFACSVCGDCTDVPTEMGEPIFGYCPNCGARMDGESDE